MSDDYAIQVSFKTPTQTLINLRVADESELDEALSIISRQLKGIGEVEEILGAMQNIYAGFSPFEKVKADAEAAANKPAAQAGPANQGQTQSGGGQPAGSDASICRHGSMVYKTGTGKNGREWKAYMCPSSNRADQCDPNWIR